MLKQLVVLPLALVAAMSITAPAIACGDASCSACEAPKNSAAPKPVTGELVTSTYKVDGMHCDKCVGGVTNLLSTVAGVSKVDVSLAKKTVAVTHAKGQVTMANLQAALGDHFKLAAEKPAAVEADDCCAPAAAPQPKAKPAPKH